MEEKDTRKKKKQKEVKQNHEGLQALNKTLRRTTTQEKNKNGRCLLSSTSVSIEGPKGCLGSLLSSSSSSAAHSQQPSSSGSHFQRKPKSCSENTCKNKPLAAKSESTPDLTRPEPKRSSLKSRKKPFFLPQWQSGKNSASKASQRPKLSAGLSNSLRTTACGSERYGVNQREAQGLGEPSDFNFIVPNNFVGLENSTPVGKLLCGSSLNYAIVDDQPPVGEDSNSANITVKTTTPPVEASVSPEIQGGSYIAVATSTMTPVCYGDGHLISGVTDKRKCRSRGILTVRSPTDLSGFENVSSYEDYVNENAVNVLFKSRNSLIPLPAEASVNWLSSPLGKEGEVQRGDSSDSSRPLGLASIYIPSSSSSFCQFSPDLLSDGGDKGGHGNSNALTSTRKTRIAVLSPRRVSVCQGLLDFSSEKKDVDFSATPQAKSICRMVRLPEEGGCSYSLIGDQSRASIDPLSCSNVIQTPSSNTSSESCVCISWIDAHGHQFSPDQGMVGRDFQMASLSPKIQMSMWDPPVLSPRLPNLASPSQSTDVIKVEKKLDGCASWISDSTLENMSLSQMRISWREGLASLDEFDCCRCLSDEGNNDEKLGEFQDKSLQAFGIENDDSLRSKALWSPEFLEQEPEILRKEKESLSPVGPNTCAESISTDASGLAASRDSDWTLDYKNHLFQV